MMSREKQSGRRKTGRAYRRSREKIKTKRLFEIISNGYNPARGYVKHHLDENGEWIPNSYIRYPKHSHPQKFLKGYSNKVIRRNSESLPPKGNHYRRLIEYWWTLY